eukprot:Amastigsp_a342151_11.p2 type:complete len:237 gc:universal Amastigsp_a342151_11:1655-2365(+)
MRRVLWRGLVSRRLLALRRQVGVLPWLRWAPELGACRGRVRSLQRHGISVRRAGEKESIAALVAVVAAGALCRRHGRRAALLRAPCTRDLFLPPTPQKLCPPVREAARGRARERAFGRRHSRVYGHRRLDFAMGELLCSHAESHRASSLDLPHSHPPALGLRSQDRRRRVHDCLPHAHGCDSVLCRRAARVPRGEMARRHSQPPLVQGREGRARQRRLQRASCPDGRALRAPQVQA